MIINFVKNNTELGAIYSAYNISCLLADLGFKVLIIDFEPNAFLTQLCFLGVIPPNTAHDVLTGNKSIDDCIEKTVIDNLYLLPPECCLATIELMNAKETSVKNEFSEALDRMNKWFDYIIFNNEPGIGKLCLTSLIAGDFVTASTTDGLSATEFLEYAMNLFMYIKGYKTKLENLNVYLTWFECESEDTCVVMLNEYEDNHNILEDIWDNYKECKVINKEIEQE